MVGFAANVPVRGRHIFEPSVQMHNRGNGKGGGIAAACLDPTQLGVDSDTLKNDYILQVALLDPEAEKEVEEQCVSPYLDIHHKTRVQTQGDYRDFGLEVKPPDVVRYFVRAKQGALDAFAAEEGLSELSGRALEDEFIYRNTNRLNATFYTSLGEKRAFVLSHARNLVIMKVVGFAETVVAVLRHGGLQRPGVDRPPALPHQGPRVAPRRQPPLHRAQRGPGAQRRLCQLLQRQRIPAPARHRHPVPHRHRGCGPAVRPVDQGVPLSP